MISITTVADLEAWLANPCAPEAMINAVPLEPYKAALSALDLKYCAFAGYAPHDPMMGLVAQKGAHIIPDYGQLPFSNCPHALYDVAWLYGGLDAADATSWGRTRDHAGFLFYNEKANQPRPLSALETVAARLHDTFVEAALMRYRQNDPSPVIAFMGGHDMGRGTKTYGRAVKLARDLTRCGFRILTGGGPGLMEAGNLGAFLAAFDEAAMQEALSLLQPAAFNDFAWLKSACLVRETLLGAWDAPTPEAGHSISIPTWHYGHEPPNMFASHIAKMFYNALREDGLVSLANGGIIFFEGNAGTVQEIFQDLTQNYYRGDLSATPMVFFNPDFWSPTIDTNLEVKPRPKSVLGLVEQMAGEKGFLDSVLASKDLDEIIGFFERHRPKAVGDIRHADQKLRCARTT